MSSLERLPLFRNYRSKRESSESAAAMDGQGYFHVQWRRENPTDGWGEEYDHLVPRRAAERGQQIVECRSPRSGSTSAGTARTRAEPEHDRPRQLRHA